MNSFQKKKNMKIGYDFYSKFDSKSLFLMRMSHYIANAIFLNQSGKHEVTVHMHVFMNN